MSKRHHGGRGDARQPLPAGHPDTWGLITRGTCLEGTPWPGPGGSSLQDARKRVPNHRAQSRSDE